MAVEWPPRNTLRNSPAMRRATSASWRQAGRMPSSRRFPPMLPGSWSASTTSACPPLTLSGISARGSRRRVPDTPSSLRSRGDISAQLVEVERKSPLDHWTAHLQGELCPRASLDEHLLVLLDEIFA